jgi:DNA-binding NtrC family response regulator
MRRPSDLEVKQMSPGPDRESIFLPQLTQKGREARGLAQLVGEAPAFKQAIGEIPIIAEADAPVLITGETGTGKELVARAVHYLSQRASFPFVPVNCGALPETLLEDELFGHQRGAFTDAHSVRPGLLAQADKGTLFLDEIDTLPGRAQVALLRVLQDKTFRPLGSHTDHQADIRVVASSNAPLGWLIDSGSFRADLYYRLCVFSIALPALRDRRQDIIPLAYHFLRKHTPAGRSALEVSGTAGAALASSVWPGNVRELENTIIRAIHLCKSGVIEAADLRLQSPGQGHAQDAADPAPESSSFRDGKKAVVEKFEHDYLIRLLSDHQGNVSRAARAAGKERRDLGKLLKKYGLDPRTFGRALQSGGNGR